MSIFGDLRVDYHKKIRKEIIRLMPQGKGAQRYYNMADGSNISSIEISQKMVEQLPYDNDYNHIPGQTSGDLFEKFTLAFVESAFSHLGEIRPGNWSYSTTQTDISQFDQYHHLADLSRIIDENKALSAIIGLEYLIKPDIIVSRQPINIDIVNSDIDLINNDVCLSTPILFRDNHNRIPILHASISCKWTIRSDRSQNTRTEALNLIRNRKGNLPHIVSVTAEPLPTRIATLALGTGDLDCVYHFALYELKRAVELTKKHDQLDLLMTMVDGRRLRDISDLPLDLAI